MQTISPPKTTYMLARRTLPRKGYVRYNVHMKKTYTATQARANLFKILDDVQRPDAHLTITSDGEPKAVIVSHEYYESLIETLEVLSHENFIKDLKEAEADIKAGRVYSHEEVMNKLKINL